MGIFLRIVLAILIGRKTMCVVRDFITQMGMIARRFRLPIVWGGLNLSIESRAERPSQSGMQ